MFFTPASVKQFNSQNHSIVIWSEAKHYWNTFTPIVKYFKKNKIDFVYIASDKDDEGLRQTKQNVYIGTGNKCFRFLNNIKSDIFICTTPNLGDLALKRSKLVKHYIHIVHAPTDFHSYRRVGFECFDTVMCAGSHQIDTIRHLEKIRGTEKKNLTKTGCLYYDNMVVKDKSKGQKQKSVLIAPTWGQNNILRYYQSLLPNLLRTGMNICIRPHPQSLKSEKSFIEKIQSEYKDNKNISWDIGTDGAEVFSKSSVMITHMSGVAFDYALVHKKPVVLIEQNVDYTDMEGLDIDYPAWELSVQDKLGLSVSPNDLNNIDKVINKALKHKSNLSNTIFNFKKAGDKAGRQIIDILEGLK